MKSMPQHTKNHIEFVGVELEGYWHSGHGNLKHDGSVHFDDVENEECQGECRGECNCYSYCECEECQNCDNCDNNITDCKCYECLLCSDCNNKLENCECTIESVCKKESCIDNQVCDDCADNFTELQNLDYDCAECGNQYNNCDLDCRCDCECECDCENNLVGEVSSHKLKIHEVEKWILVNYPNEVNSTTGLHIHLSFKKDKADYSVIATEEFYEHFLNELKIWAKERNINENSRFIKRLNGVEYAKRLFLAEDQINGNNERYTQINYCYSKFNGTVEIRVGNMFNDKTISVEYVQRVIRIFNEYLSRVKPKVYRLDEIFDYDNKQFDLSLRIQQQKDGLMIYAKSARFQNTFKNYNSSFLCSYNENSLLEFDEDDSIKPNISFLRLKGLQHGSKLFIKGLYTDNMVNNYLDRIHDTLSYDVNILENKL